MKEVLLSADLAVVGGGLSGTCAALTAARAGLKVVLIQDRPVLGGNASSEVRLWILGATAHMTNNNRWAREGGVVDEILVENMHRNPEGNAVIVDTILLEKVREEKNITLLLNTAVDQVRKRDTALIDSVRAYCSQNETSYIVQAPLYCDASGDGVVAYLAGAAFRMGAEARQEFDEGYAPSPEYGELLGHSIYFYSRDTGKPVKFTPPGYALRDITEIPHYRQLSASSSGCRLWWLEWGGRLDTVHDTETIKWELWKVAYGVWNYIKNSGKFPDAGTLALEWVGVIPGKRESRRFEGDYILQQRDLVEQRPFADAVSYGGWSLDLHPADGVYSPRPSCTQWHAKGIYQIPYRCLYSRNVRNLFLAGRIVSVSHVAFSSTRVMATCAHSAQAAGMAAALCRKENLLPRDLTRPDRMKILQRELLKSGQYIPGLALDDPQDLARQATVSASSRFLFGGLDSNGRAETLDADRALLLPVPAGPMPAITLPLDASHATTLDVELRSSSRPANFTPDVTLARRAVAVPAGGRQPVRVDFGVTIDQPRYVLVCLMRNPAVAARLSGTRLTGVLSLSHKEGSKQRPPEDIGIDSFELWAPARRPGGQNLAFSLTPALDLYRPENVTNGIARPTLQPNAWVAAPDDLRPWLELRWRTAQTIAQVDLSFDTDFDHPMESVLLGHPESDMPFCVKHYRLLDSRGGVLAEVGGNHQTRNRIAFPEPVTTDSLRLEILETRGAPAAVFEIRCYTARRS